MPFVPSSRFEFQVAGVTPPVETNLILAGATTPTEAFANDTDAFKSARNIPVGTIRAIMSGAVLVQGYSWYATVDAVVSRAVLAIGGGGLISLISNWGKSTERRGRAVAGRRRARFRSMNLTAGMGQYPSVPDSSFVTRQSGDDAGPIACP